MGTFSTHSRNNFKVIGTTASGVYLLNCLAESVSKSKQLAQIVAQIIYYDEICIFHPQRKESIKYYFKTGMELKSVGLRRHNYYVESTWSTLLCIGQK